MATSRRSTTGCTLCKTRRKKCDETKPQCLRCIASGNDCVYEYVAHSEGDRHRIKRTKPGPRATSGLSRGSRDSPASPSDTNLASSISTASEDSSIYPHSTLIRSWGDEIYPDSNHVVPRGVVSSLSLSPMCPIPLYVPSGLEPVDISPISQDLVLPSTALIPATSGSISQETMIPWVEDDDNDPEGIRVILFTTPTVDRNARENALPFVLYCYSQWALARVFEPIKLAHVMREQVVSQFSSEATRNRAILIANVMEMFATKLKIDSTRKCILDNLVSDVLASGSFFTDTPPSFVPALDRKNAMCTLDNMLEIFSLQIATGPITSCVQTLRCAAPVFRRACSEPPGQPVNLPNILIQSNLNLRNFATLDIIQCITTGLPTCIQYESPFSLELCERMHQPLHHSGLQWLHGFPDQFILLFGWIISLCETPGASNNILEVVAWIENNLPRIRVAIDESGDPLFRIGRMVVQECWRFAVLIYLYMALCGADAHDPRVVRAHKGFMRLIRGVKPARNPDAYLFTPASIAGVATVDDEDRETLRLRIFGVHECTERGTVGNDVLLELEDIWARTRDEGRPAVWLDLRIACFRVTGR
ncbi:fungal-specific transcription factor domain-containing protein [Rhizoctonia solani]|nr:fungal-specific transcription factor domain-containing protein [Rhizoctonia solani]